MNAFLNFTSKGDPVFETVKNRQEVYHSVFFCVFFSIQLNLVCGIKETRDLHLTHYQLAALAITNRNSSQLVSELLTRKMCDSLDDVRNRRN